MSCAGPSAPGQRKISDLVPPSAPQTLATATAAQAIRAPSSPSDYRIHPLDTIEINVFNETNLSVKEHVSAQGTINYPLLGTVRVAGLTVTETENLLKERLGHDYLVNPQVSVLVDQTNRRVFLLGQVRSPGAIEFPPDQSLTLLQAIARAGGFTPIAAADRVSIIRSESGSEMKITVNVAAIIKSGDKSKDVELRPDDVVSVPESVF
ncbi:MAG TPA: polysaccharide biosynthesis/export family protein [Verrucomicrobiae bacterium]|nr:polysaccharide biosynthesis/export family protein [Verrucomicrobiae bacterium]